MSSTTFGPVFSVGASRHLYEMLDTETEGVGCAVPTWVAAPASKNRLLSSISLIYDTTRLDGGS
jgi:hypothetical protein